MRFCYGVLVILAGWQLSGCDDSPAVNQPAFKKHLSDYGFFSAPMREIRPVPGVVGFDLINPLYSDEAVKSRFFRLPEQGQIRYSSVEPFDFPEGTFLIKNFAFRNADGTLLNVETRLMWLNKGEWIVANYIWDDEQVDAELDLSGNIVPMEHLNDKNELVTFNYEIPDKSECTTCHSRNGTVVPIGLKARHLNRTVVRDGGSRNQLKLWEEQGWLTNVSGEIPYVPAVEDENISVELRARAYLDINCGHCHSAAGTARSSSLFLDFGEQENVGLCKIPIAGGVGGPSRPYVITAGSADSSLLVYRLESLNPQVKMPEVGRGTVDSKGVALIRAWIDSMEQTSCQE